MKQLLCSVLLAALVGCGKSQNKPATLEPLGTTSQYSMRVSARENTWLVLEPRWREDFGVEPHNDYALYYVRERNWWQGDERREVQHWIGGKREWSGPVLRRIAADTIAVDVPDWHGKIVTSTYASKGPWPN